MGCALILSLLYCSTRVSGFAVSGARALRCLLCGCISIKFHINEWKVTVNQNESKLFKFILDSLKHKGRNDNYIFYDLITVYNRRKIKILSLKFFLYHSSSRRVRILCRKFDFNLVHSDLIHCLALILCTVE